MPRITVKTRFGPQAAAPDPMPALEPQPSAAELRWGFINNAQLGVHAFDPLGHKIGTNIANQVGVGLNWYPVDRFKQTLVGTVEGFDFYDPSFSLIPDEADWNIYIRPTPAFRFIRDDVLPNVGDRNDLHRAQDGEPLVECEITPDQEFYDNPFFNEDGTSSLIGQTIGVYGPWVQDEGHSFRPEIHPCELVWWRTVAQGGLRTWHLMVLQDDSNRFDRPDNFSGGGRIVRPWSAFPRKAEFRLAIRVQNNQRRRLVIEELFARNVRPSAPASSPLLSRRPVGGGSTLEIERAFGNRANVGIRVETFSRSGPNTLIGYVVLTSEVGNNDRGQEGFHVLRVTERT